MDLMLAAVFLAVLHLSTAAAGVLPREERSVQSSQLNVTSGLLAPPYIIQGPRGRDGRDGLPGRDGRDGAPGRQGLQGPRGPQAGALPREERSVQSSQMNITYGPPVPPYIMQGPRGRDGRDGLPGRDGRDGAPGRQGERGDTGLQGPVGPQGPPGPTTGGVVYTRWGRTTCPSTPGTQLLYAGRAAGSHYSQKGGGANYICLPEQPQYSTYTAGTQAGRAYLYGAEYETSLWDNNGPLSALHDHNVPCAVCYASTRETVVMIPARLSCPSSWTREYYGYLMANWYGHHHTMFECVDRNAQSIPGSIANTDGAFFYHVEVKCSVGIPCPPYDTQKEVTCVVCTK